MHALAPTYIISVHNIEETLPPIPDRNQVKAHLLLEYRCSMKDPIIVCANILETN